MNSNCAAASKAEFAAWILSDDRILREFCQDLDLEEARLRQWVRRLEDNQRHRIRSFGAAVDDSIEQLHEIFAGYGSAMDLSSGARCITQADRQRLIEKPLRQLDGDDLAWYSHKALTLWGNIAAFKYFLPRLLTLASQPGSGVFFTTLLDKLRHADCRRWPRQERVALAHCLHQLWQEAMGQYPHAIAMDDLLRAMLILGQDPRPLLHRWLHTVTPAAAQHLADLVLDYHRPSAPANTLHRDPTIEKTTAMVHRWLSSSENPRRYLTQAFFLYASSDFSDTIFEAEEILRRYYF